MRETARRLDEAAPQSPDDVRAHPHRLAGHSAELKPHVAELQRFLFDKFYRHPYLVETEERASRTLRALFESLMNDPTEMPPWFQRWMDQVGPERAVCDYIAGMTDSFADEESTRLNS